MSESTQSNYDESLFTRKLIDAELTEKQVEAVLEAIEDVCNYCWDSLDGCHCWNDE